MKDNLPESDPFPNYRANIGIVLLNKAGQVWIGHRKGYPEHNGWQFPQGGMDENETPLACAHRELFEETGVTPANVKFLTRSQDWVAYNFPNNVKSSLALTNIPGQKQLWFAFRFFGSDADFKLDTTTSPEFDAFKWGTLKEATKLIIVWKRHVYEDISAQFKQFEAV